MRSLRLRFFLISWPLVVAAIAVVAFGIDRYAVVELERIETGPLAAPDRVVREAWAEALGAAWTRLPTEEGKRVVARMAESSTPRVAIVVLATDGAIVVSTDPTVRLAPKERGQGGPVRLLRRVEPKPGMIAEAELSLTGTPVQDASGAPLGQLLVLPVEPERAARHAPHEAEPAGSASWRAGFRRTLWTAAVAASLAAAAAALLLAGPLVRQVRRLSAAAGAIRDGALNTRVRADGADELAQLGRSFNAMAGALEHAEAHKRNLVTDVAHELRTPLTNIVGLIEAMQDGLRPPDAPTLASLREEAGLLSTLVDELQELSLAESGQLAFVIETIDAVAAVRAAVEAIRPSAGGVAVRGPAGALPILVRADARRLGQVLRNLLRNSVTHTPPEGLVTVEVTSLGARVAIVVADTGRGIPKDHLPQVWERFHRVDRSRDRASGGMGIGLALVRQLVVGMGGEVSAESELGRGSCFRVELPT